MRILITTHRIVSHFRPMLPFAHGLKSRGHEVRVAALPDLAEEIAGHGFGHLALNGPTDDARNEIDERAKLVPREKIGKFYMSQMFMGLLPRTCIAGLLDELADWRPDLILRETTEFSGLIAAEKIGVRHARFEIVNGESEESIATNYASEIDAIKSFAGLAPTGHGYLKSELSFSAHPEVLDDTPRVNSKSPVRFRSATPTAKEIMVPPDWLPINGRPFLYMTFGTVAADVERVQHIYTHALEAVADLPVNVLMTTGANAPADLLSAVPDNVVVRDFVPQAEILPHAQLMICHGGSGTVLGGLAAGVPMVIVPMFADQPDNARCLAASGLCKTVSDGEVAALRAAIVDALKDDAMRTRAAQTARDVAAMPTVEQALDRLQSH